MRDGGEATGAPSAALQGVFRIPPPEAEGSDARRLFSRAEEDRIRRSVDQDGGPIPCPRCGGGLDVRGIPPRADVAYVRDRILLVCNGCGRTLVVDRRDAKGGRPR